MHLKKVEEESGYKSIVIQKSLMVVKTYPASGPVNSTLRHGYFLNLLASRTLNETGRRLKIDM